MHDLDIPDLEMFEHSYYCIDENGTVLVPETHSKSVYWEIFNFIGWRYEPAIKRHFAECPCHVCTEEDLGDLGLTPAWIGFLYKYLTGLEYADFVHKSKELGEQHAVEEAVTMVNTLLKQIESAKAYASIATAVPLVYHEDAPLGYTGHYKEVFLTTVREGVKEQGLKVMSMDEFMRSGMH